VAARRFATVASERSFNNELGVPLTLANAPATTEVAVIEMGARGSGHIRFLCELARPTVGVVTVVRGVHTEVMGPIERIAVAKRELVEGLPAHGAAVLNADDPNVAAMAGHTDAAVVTFGAGGEVHAEGVEVDDELRPRFTLRSPWGTVPVRLAVRGAHNVTNALAAAAAGLWMGVDVEDVADGLTQPPASPWRMELIRVPDGPTVLNDAYNAGPASMAAALQALAELPVGGEGRRIAVLGVMAELGPEGPAEHRRIAAMALDLGIDVLAVGTDQYGEAGRGAVIDVVAGADDVATALRELQPEDAVLVKGSRVAGLERAAEALTRPGR
jgi:UDP-N-acetylmuramoyl-tripeptide--D-alanyl-D-alanine ligase